METTANMSYLETLIDKINARFARSSVGRVFRLEGSGHVRLPSIETRDARRKNGSLISSGKINSEYSVLD